MPSKPITRGKLLSSLRPSLEEPGLQAAVLRYALAPACVLLAVLVHLSPAGSLFPYGGSVRSRRGRRGVVRRCRPGIPDRDAQRPHAAAAHRGGPPSLVSFLDLPRFIVFSVIGIAVGWGSSRGASKLREQERYARAMEASDDGFWDWIPATDTVYTSPRLLEIYGFAPGTTFNGRDDLVRRFRSTPRTARS